MCQSWEKVKKVGKISSTKINMEKYFTANYVNWQQISDMTGYKTSILERQKIDRVSPVTLYLPLQNYNCFYKLLNTLRIIFEYLIIYST